ncbi:MAG: ABC transporter permease [Thermoflexales bacterium]|nr:ABC transporter permease [Thermoflexales bacterium]MCS7325152.1 ABC transporter permease [Thermoflexales bacterium]MCX7938715.1 ABC transporter permease [Thermoflexales bacterium]MDW8054449.1 ABC transporter permease [Anaerolineae bacterium]MDW8292761.1 ABC transporter permease [Anaerolineae bacterium]
MQALWTPFRELWAYRSLLRLLVMRDLKVRYRGSALGVLWSFLQPLGMMVVMSFVFGVINRGPAEIERYNVFILSGLLAWNFFAAAVVSGAGSVLSNAALVKKVYFPRVILPLASVVASLVNYALALPMWVVVALVSGHPLRETLLLLPLVVLMQAVLSAGLAMLLATLNVFYRDTQFIVDLSMLALFFLTPIWYDIAQAQSITLLGQVVELSTWIRRLNPMASLVNLYQDLMYWGRLTTPEFVLRTALTCFAFLAIGWIVFHRYSPRFGEEL